MSIGCGIWKIEWVDGRRDPQNAPNPAYPNGIDIRLTTDATVGPTCINPLPYPAKRCGYFVVFCESCDQRVIVTTAGRPDDPRSLQLAGRVE
jgi:hypothetical protein